MKNLLICLLLIPFNKGFCEKIKLEGIYTEYKTTLLNGEDGSNYTFDKTPFQPCLKFNFIPDSSIVIIEQNSFSKMRKMYTLNKDLLIMKLIIKRGVSFDTIYNSYKIEKDKDDYIFNEYKEGLDEFYFLKKHSFKKGDNILPKKEMPSEIFTIVEESPEFPGGNTEIAKFVGKEVHYPAKVKNAKPVEKVFLKLLIGLEGKIIDAEILVYPRIEFAKEAMAVLRKFPAFSPGKMSGKPVYVFFNLPISFRQ